MPDIVVLGLDDTLNYEKIRKGCNYIIKGAKFIVTHPDIKAPMGDDYMPDAGSMMANVKKSALSAIPSQRTSLSAFVTA